MIFYPFPRWGNSRSRTSLARFPSTGSACKPRADLNGCFPKNRGRRHQGFSPFNLNQIQIFFIFSNPQSKPKKGDNSRLFSLPKYVKFSNDFNSELAVHNSQKLIYIDLQKMKLRTTPLFSNCLGRISISTYPQKLHNATIISITPSGNRIKTHALLDPCFPSSLAVKPTACPPRAKC